MTTSDRVPADLYIAGLAALQAGDLRAVEAALRLLAPVDLVRAWDLLELTRVAVAVGYPDDESTRPWNINRKSASEG